MWPFKKYPDPGTHKDDPGYEWDEDIGCYRILAVCFTEKELRDFIQEEIRKSEAVH